MKVKVLYCNIIKGADYKFANVTCLKENGYGMKVRVQDYHCNLDEIKKGDIYNCIVLEDNKEQAVLFELVKKAAVEIPASVKVDVDTGEVIEEPPLPEPPAEVLAADARDKAKQNKNKS